MIPYTRSKYSSVNKSTHNYGISYDICGILIVYTRVYTYKCAAGPDSIGNSYHKLVIAWAFLRHMQDVGTVDM